MLQKIKALNITGYDCYLLIFVNQLNQDYHDEWLLV